jgi:tetratricopeptide (TPR) repeat protein
VTELEPEDKVAWTNLGRAYLGLRQTELAIAAFRKQIEVNPYDEYAYYFLGRAHVTLKKYSEAEEAFQKQLELNPLDKYTRASLGALYLERRQYDRAVPQLEQAIALTPDSAWLQVQLGKAYVNLKRDREAVAAFDRAVELAPTPTMWNDIAYELALSAVHLDRALQYAESAVASATAASRNLDVNRADTKAMNVVQSMAAYWDTLGWVYFARGDLTRAERFVEAAWSLSHEAEVGDHLGQIYEKLGRRDDAIRMYALALAAERPPDDIRDRLARLAGDQTKVDDLVKAHREQLTNVRTVAISTKGTPGKKADFLVLFSSPSTVESVKFVSGDDGLRPLGDAIRKASYRRMFPDDVAAKILMRGTLSCAPSAAGCTFTLKLPTDADSAY